MRTIPAGFLNSHVTELQVCWEVIRRDEEVIRGTECDEDLLVTTGNHPGLYLARAGITGSDIRSTSDMSVDNLEVTGALDEFRVADSSSVTSSTDTLQIFDLSAPDLEAGLFDNADATTFLVKASDPDLYQHVLRTGWLGNVVRTAEGQYKTELRGLTQALSQQIVKTYGVACQWELGSTPSTNPPGLCRVDMTAHTFTDTVATVYSRRELATDTVLRLTQTVGGTITFTSGLNAGYSMQIKSYVSLHMELYLPMPRDITAGDTFIFRRGCDKKRSTCIDVYNNIDNHGAWGTFVPGQSEILKVGKR